MHKQIALPILLSAVLITPDFFKHTQPLPLTSLATLREDKSTLLNNFIAHLSDSLNAQIGVAFHDLETDEKFFYNEDTIMHAASTMKVPVMIEVFRQAEAGKFKLDDSLEVKNEFKSIVDGSAYSMDIGEDSDEAIYNAIGTKMTIRQLVFQMITVSSNLATNILIDLVDAKNVMKTLNQLGIQNMHVLRGVEDIKAYRLDMNNRTDAISFMQTLEVIATSRAADSVSCEEMIEILKAQKFRHKIPAGLPSSLVSGNKTGSITRISHDGAIVSPPKRKPFVLAILTRNIDDQKQAAETIANITRQLYLTLVQAEAAN